MHLIIEKRAVQQHARCFDKYGVFFGKNVLDLPRQDDQVRPQADVDWHTAEEDAGGRHRDDAEAGGDQTRADAEVDDRVVGRADLAVAIEADQRRHGVDQNAQRIRAVVVEGLPVGDNVFILRVGQR